MKSIGVVRKVDELGRIVIPVELRRTLGIDIKDPIEIFVEQDKIILKKYESSISCVFCEEASAVVFYKNKAVCKECATSLGHTVAVSS